MTTRALAFGLFAVASGCGATGKAYGYEDKVAVRNAFIEVVKQCYRERRDGTLQAPAVDPKRVRFVFLYDKEVDRADSECVDLTFGSQPNANQARPVYRVLAFQAVPGLNRVLKDETRRIEEMLQERLGPVPK